MYISVLLLQGALVLLIAGSCNAAAMTNSWAVQIESDAGGEGAADELASKYGLTNLGQVGNLKNVYHFLKPVQGFDKTKAVDGVPVQYHLTQQLKDEQNVGYVQQQERRKLHKKEGYAVPNDPNWSDQWSLLNTGQLNSGDVGNDLNVERAWLQGVTGCGSVVAIVDDGVEYTHSDLTTNYVQSLQYDFLRRSSDPFPVTVDGVRESHGTNVAGEVAMEKGNNICGVGVAYNSFITALRLISSPGATDMDEADALSWKGDVVDIYSNSWGPADTGFTVAGPEPLLQMVLETSVQEGRDGKGSIYTFAAGNGGTGDTCAADGYTNSIYTISVGSASSNGRQSSFDEQCSGKMVVTFDSNPYEDDIHVTTTNVQNTCNSDFIGTSASTPLVSGVLALLLEANPDLTWRDVQYLIAYTSNRTRLVDGEWVTNGGGLQVSHKFGFGAIDAEAIVTRGRNWINVPPQMSQEVTLWNGEITLSPRETSSLSFDVESDIVFLEHVVLVFEMSFVGVTEDDLYYYFDEYYSGYSVYWPERGRITVELTSPSGTTSTLLPLRSGDIYPDSYSSWPFMSVHFWGEDPAGNWTITVSFTDVVGEIVFEVPGVTFYGTSQVPEAVSLIPSDCSSECDSTRGCAATGAEYCDACADLRVASSHECTDVCPEALIERNGYCYNSTEAEASCEAVKPNPVMEPSLKPASPALSVQPLHMCLLSAVLVVAIALQN